ncbi:flagellar biosynthesis protein [Caloramator fervidus]|uniref:Flagellar biosynthesis protein n=1 Tax=Caloramator fervidus TaxID=29344 RepID=A0A1H5SM92_9CLOT|nr:EscU/YscU/HrcU family type III secretion system export apparatus switch protein [Caloramator fervidus]SEF51709.1 flagellar biosynthesis protein [Caloramator fervidus]
MKKKAVALKYNKNLKAPYVTAVGFGQVAEKIIKIAKESNIPIVENENLVDSLSKLPLNQPIPPELYEAVAEIIAFVYKINNQIK